MRAIYTFLWWLALPFVPVRLWWRARREPGYLQNVGERFGAYRNASPQGELIWIHAVSVGETRAAAPLVDRLRRERPDATLLLTCMTAAGRATGASLYGERVLQAWLPYDLPFAVERFLAHFRPVAGVLMETELWPNLIDAAHRRGIPMFLVNARMSARSAKGYARAGSLTRATLNQLRGIAAQSADDAKRLRELGASDVVVTGNVKFDIDIPDAMRALGVDLRSRINRERPVWLAASTREGEENLILDALARKRIEKTLLLLVPRHPQRFDDVARLLDARRVPFVRRSTATVVGDDIAVMLGDSMGEMLAYCAASDVAFVGGSLKLLGGQNLLEPLALGVPTLVGPHTFNFAEITERAIEAGAVKRVADADALLAAVDSLLNDTPARARMRDAAQSFMTEHRAAIDRLWRWLNPKLDER
ncbi:MAG TPA: lipid IV(A) 3-deoxy-D-manno-octulosonic acid transferase [Casimicrobiaceae bacterium]|nr:lipid IV(A) 3-deoxy-D-manno-octulosonic acid transferase [Casimicrobiaceae bacterium]